MKTKISVKNRTVSWTGEKPKLQRALEDCNFHCSGDMLRVAECNLDPWDYDSLGELVEKYG